MGAFSDLFGYIPKVKVLEAFAENPDDALSAPEIERITEVSRRAAYLIVQHYVNAGVIVPSGPKGETPRRFRLNPNDLRSRTVQEMERLITLGSIQSEIKRRREIPQDEPLPEGILSRIPMIVVVVGWRNQTSSVLTHAESWFSFGKGPSEVSTPFLEAPTSGPTPHTFQFSDPVRV